MAETADDLSTPLGQKKARGKRRFRLPFTGMQALAVLLGLFLAVCRLRHFQRQSARRRTGRPGRDQSAERRRRKGPPADPGPRAGEKPDKAGAAPPDEQKTVTIIDGSSGARHKVVIGRRGHRQGRAGSRPDDDGGIDPPAREIALWHDPGGRRRTEAVHRLRRRGRPRQGCKNAGSRDRRRRPRRRRGQDHRSHHETAGRGNAGVHALRSDPDQTHRAGAPNATRSCCKSRWNLSTIPTTIPGRRPC